MIGGKKFRNFEKKLPKGEYYECDVDYDGKARGINRLVYTEDGIVYHSKDHYISFLAAVSDNGVQLVKMYPEGIAEARFKISRVKHIYAFCNRHGLYGVSRNAI